MTRTWYIIDDAGARPVALSRYRGQRAQAPWPSFTQVIVQASAPQVITSLERFAAARARGEGSPLDVATLIVASRADLTLVAEPDSDMDSRWLADEAVDDLLESLGQRGRGAFVGYDAVLGALHVMLFEEGRPALLWYDAPAPGPSQATTFHADGRCTQEDARRYAQRVLGCEGAPALDRFAFVEAALSAHLGLRGVSPDLSAWPGARTLSLRA